jgi:hypothetical protein
VYLIVKMALIRGAALAVVLANAASLAMSSQISLASVDTKSLFSDNTAFYGLSTYANVPYVHCLAPEGIEVEPFDIAILGAPFDTGTTGRPGARFGPRGSNATVYCPELSLILA